MKNRFGAAGFDPGSSGVSGSEACPLVRCDCNEGVSANEAAPESRVLAVSAEYNSVPMRFPANSIVLAETARRREATVSDKRPWAVFQFIWNFLKLSDFADAGLLGKISVVFTTCGPLVYQWERVYYASDGSVPQGTGESDLRICG